MAAPQLLDWYDTPLYYDIIFDEDSVREADFLEAVHRRHGRSRGRCVLELACGSGRLIAQLAARAWRAEGFDGHPAMLDFARQRLAEAGLTARLWQDRMESFRRPARPRYDLAHCLVSTFKYLLSEAEALACLDGVAASLKPGGLFVLGLHLTPPRLEERRPTHERWVASREGIEVTCNTRTWPPAPGSRLETMRTRLRIRFPDGAERLQETRCEVRSYTAAQLRALLRKCPDLVLLEAYDFRHDPEATRPFDDSYADLVLVLGRR